MKRPDVLSRDDCKSDEGEVAPAKPWRGSLLYIKSHCLLVGLFALLNVPGIAAAGEKPSYCVIELSEGPEASRYPVSYRAEAPTEGRSDDYRLDKLVLRRIDTARPYYIGVFELTQHQYERITGRNPSALKGAVRPVECVTWETVRGEVTKYPWLTTQAVDDDRLIGRLRARTGLAFDLPAEAQWEFA